MNLSQLANRFRPVVFLVVTLLMVFGAVSYFSLPAREDPEITIREAVVTTSYPGLSAERVERLITKPLEEALLGIPELKEIRSTSMEGVSIIHVQTEDYYFELDQIWDEVRETVAETGESLPDGASAPVLNDDFGDVSVITAALTGADYSMSEIYDFAEHARDLLYSVPGTKKVDIFGVQEERIFIEVDNARLAALDVPPGAVTAAIQAQNTIRPGGQVDTGDRAFILEPSGDFRTLQDVRQTLIELPDGQMVELGDVAKVYRGTADPPRQKAFYNGDEAIVLGIAMDPSESVLNYSARAKDKLDDIAAGLPAGLHFEIITYQADQVENAVYGVSVNVLQTLAIVLGVVILFLGVRTGLIVGSIVPAVMLATLAVMGFLDMQLERMSLATLVIALGLLVDNGIVIAEDFKRRLEEFGDRDRALKETGGELALPLLSSSLTTILVFVPLMLAQHPSGEYTRSISLVILITLLMSWLFALSVTPILCYIFTKDPNKSSASKKSSPKPVRSIFSGIEWAYEKLLRGILRIRLLFVLLMPVLFAVAALGIKSAPNSFFPESDRTQILVYVNLPAGVTTRTTENRMEEMMKIIADKEAYPGLGDYAAYVGFGGPRFVLSLAPLDPAPNVGFIVINADDMDAVEQNIVSLRKEFQSRFPDVEARVSKMFLGPEDPLVIQAQIRGPDADYVFKAADRLESIFASVPGTIDIWSNWYNRTTHLSINVDQAKARRAGITSADVSRSLSTFVSGRPISEFREDEVFPIIARGAEEERHSLDQLSTLAIYPQDGGEGVPLAAVASIEPVSEFARIQRENLIRTVTVEARNPHITPQDMVPMIRDQIEELNASMPPGHWVEFDGIITSSAEGQGALGANAPLAFGLIILLLVMQFNSFKRPLIILLTIPLIVIGASLGLKVMGADFGFIVILGLLSLAGIILNNAIVLIDRIDIERAQGDRFDWDAVVSACVRRLRPIVMTTITTIVGLLPLIIAQDVLFYGMASVLVFGLAVGTILTLGVVPALYCLFFGIKPPTKNERKLKGLR